MSDLVAIAYDDEFKAEEVRLTLAKLQREHLIELEDAAVVVKDKEGKVKLKQAVNLPAAGALSGGFWGLLIGTLFLAPVLGAAVGAASGAVGGALTDIGVDDKFMKELGETMQPGTSALFVLIRKVTPDKVLEEIAPYGGKVIRTSLSKDQESQLQEVLSKHGVSLDSAPA
ncbi:MAG: DUF1269 domain-containing protein [Oscillatoriales cyanobacterium RM2_1_1]|nr:DUF1269 domain-containing protein [Oscillatoriales cyanobacterium SM2_3_0]NJO47657.1 DUF1269 domain-containing protein [Oscillatoriales cyanobacterium RM2_1_1]